MQWCKTLYTVHGIHSKGLFKTCAQCVFFIMRESKYTHNTFMKKSFALEEEEGNDEYWRRGMGG